MTYKTRQEVLRAAADWMDVCEEAGVEARCKIDGSICNVASRSLNFDPSYYEFPLALLEGKEVWVGSKLYCKDYGRKIIVEADWESGANWNILSWNPQKPATVMVEIPLATAEWYAANKYAEAYQPYFVSEACKKALEKL